MPKVSLVKDWHFWLIRFHLASFTGPRRLVKNDIDENSWGVIANNSIPKKKASAKRIDPANAKLISIF